MRLYIYAYMILMCVYIYEYIKNKYAGIEEKKRNKSKENMIVERCKRKGLHVAGRRIIHVKCDVFFV